MNKIMPPRENFYDAVNVAIYELEEILSLYNPLEIIANISKHTAAFSFQDHADSEDMLWYPLIEYLMSLALTKPIPKSPKAMDNVTNDEVLGYWRQLKNNFSSYFGSEYASEKGRTEAAIRFKLILDYFSVRGKAYLPHVETTFLGLFRQHNDHLVNTLGFSAENFNEFILYAKREIISAIQGEVDALNSLKELYNRFSEWMKDQDTQGEAPEAIMKRFIEENPDLKSKQEHVNQLSKIPAYDAFEIRPQSKLHKKILNAISCSFEDNIAFLEPKKWRGWPTNDTIVSERPIIRVEEDYYLLSFAMLARNRIEIMESLLEQYSPDYYQSRYLPTRDRYVEDTSLDLIQKLLPDSSTYANLYYYVEEDGTRKRVELDGLVLYDDCLLLIEAKAGMLPLPAKRGSIKGLKSKVEDILKKGHSQAIRALDYIQSSSKVDFFDEKDALIVSVEGDRFRHQYLILVTLEPLFVLTSHLSSAEELGLLSGEKWPWSVYINDLRIITDMIDHPSVFLHYLNRRIELNDYPAVETYDELDYFLHYLRTGLYFSQDELKQHDIIIIVPSTVELDEYYNELSKNDVAKTKPSMKMDPTFETLLGRLEMDRPVHFSSACFHLLNCDDETRSQISEQIRKCEQRFNNDEEVKSVALRINGTGLLLGCMVDIDHRDDLVKNWAAKWLDEMDVTHVTVVLWSPPIESGSISLFEFYRKESSSLSSSE
jgi:hypothetical protein